MIPVFVALPALLTLALAGRALDLLLDLDLARAPFASRWSARAALALGALYLAALHPALLAALLFAGLVAVRTRRVPSPAGPAAPRPASHALTLVLVLAAVWMAARPPTPFYWDELVWLGKARLATHGWGALRREATDPSAGLIPPGYPLLFPLACAWLAMLRDTPAALLAGAAAVRWLALARFAAAAHATLFADARATARRAAGCAFGLLALTPLVLVHARAAYADLPVGLLAASVTLGLFATVERGDAPRALTATAAASALLAAGLKDEGAAHVVAITGAALLVALARRDRRLARTAVVVALPAMLAFAAWRALAHAHGVADPDHTLGAPALASLVPLARLLARHAADVTSWGALWTLVVATGAAAVLGRARCGPGARFAALALALQGGALATAVLCGPGRVREFAANGTLLNRLLIQLAPGAAVALALVWRDLTAEAPRGRADASRA